MATYRISYNMAMCGSWFGAEEVISAATSRIAIERLRKQHPHAKLEITTVRDKDGNKLKPEPSWSRGKLASKEN